MNVGNTLQKAPVRDKAIEFEVGGQMVKLSPSIVKNYLVNGNGNVTDQEVVMFLNLCKFNRLNPFLREAYLIKYGSSPATMVVGKDAYLRRAFNNPDYLFKNDGITVQRANTIVQKEGCCLYPGEALIGGWCRVTFLRGGKERTAFKEVSLAEYNKNMANWKSKPATMINKVAVSQCVRDAFPKDYEGVYSEEEMIASGAIPAVDAEYTEVSGETVVMQEDEDPVITNEQRQELFRTAKKYLGDRANEVVKHIINEMGFTSTTGLRVSDYAKVMAELQEFVENEEEAQQEEVVEEE